MTDDEEAEWRARLAEAVTSTLAARRARRDQRAQMKTRRDAGLRARHQAKIRRNTQPKE